MLRHVIEFQAVKCQQEQKNKYIRKENKSVVLRWINGQTIENSVEKNQT